MRESVRVFGAGVVAATVTAGALLTGTVDPAIQLAFGLPDVGGVITDAASSAVDTAADVVGGLF